MITTEKFPFSCSKHSPTSCGEIASRVSNVRPWLQLQVANCNQPTGLISLINRAWQLRCKQVCSAAPRRGAERNTPAAFFSTGSAPASLQGRRRTPRSGLDELEQRCEQRRESNEAADPPAPVRCALASYTVLCAAACCIVAWPTRVLHGVVPGLAGWTRTQARRAGNGTFPFTRGRTRSTWHADTWPPDPGHRDITLQWAWCLLIAGRPHR